MTYAKAKIGAHSHTFHKNLFDSGCRFSCIMLSAIPEGVPTYAIAPKRLLSDTGETIRNRRVTLAKMRFPEFV